MDLWRTDLEPMDSMSVLAVNEQFVESPNLSSNSVECSPENSRDHAEPFKIEISPKSALLAKKRLQAYCNGKTDICKESKTDSATGKPAKSANHKVKKIYPDESAKAVIRDIELLKRAGYGYAPQGPSPALPSDIIIPGDSVLHFSLADVHSPSDNNATHKHSISERKNNMFKKREIKCRNIRKNDVNPRRSLSPSHKNEEDIKEKDCLRKSKLEYPKNWTEYKEMGLSIRKDEDLKAKLFRKSKDRKFEFKRYFTFETPSMPLETYKITAKGSDKLRIPFSYLRCTAEKPAIMYSENQRLGSKGFLTRKQLFTLISKDHKSIIEKLSKFSKCQPDDKPAKSGKWYPKTWRKVENSEAMLLEQSAGLSFLQGYSDEEDTTINQNVTQDQPIEVKPSNLITEKIDFALDKLVYNAPTIENDNLSQEEELTPQCTPKMVNASLTEDFDEKQDDLRQIINAKRSRLDYEKIAEDNLSINDYDETRRELEELEASLEPLELSLEGSIQTLREDDESRRKRKKKRRKNERDVKKMSKKYLKKNESNSDSEDMVRKNRKKKKASSKGKIDKFKRRKSKKKKIKRKRVEPSSNSASEIDSELEVPKKRKKKRSESQKIRGKIERDFEKKYLSSDSGENYEDDIKFFADRLDAEKRLKGKSKHRQAKTIILLDDLNFQESKDKISKEEIKVDLLKLNEDYIREQRKKDHIIEAEEAIKVDNVKIKEEVIDSTIDELMILDNIPIPPETVEAEDSATKRKNLKSDSDESEIKKVRLSSSELIPLAEIKLEKDVEQQTELEEPTKNSWGADEDLFSFKSDPIMNIELSPTLLLKDIKVEKDILNIEDLQKKTAALIAEGEKRLKKESSAQAQKRSINVDPEFFDIEMAPTKKKRSDKFTPEVKVEVIDSDNNNSNSCAALENEYEEFIKSVSTVGNKEPQLVKPIEIDSSSDSSLQFIEEITDTSMVDVPTVHIPLPPPPVTSRPEQEVKPVPVPSPKIEAVLDLNKPLINLSLSANLTQNITLSLATSIPSISTPTTTSINFSKPNVEISNDAMVSMNNIPLPLHKTPSDIKVSHYLVPPQPPETFINIASPPKAIALEPELEPFTSITLPSKKILLDNSTVKLDDSDNEDEQIEQYNNLEELQTEDKRKDMVAKNEEKKKVIDNDIGGKSEVLSRGDKTRRKSSPFKAEVKHSSPRRRSKRESPFRSRRGRDSPVRKRLSSPRRRPLSPRRRSPNRRSPLRRRRSPGRRSLSPRRRISPRRRKSPSPQRRSPHKPRLSSPKRRRSFSPKGRRPSGELKERKRSKSPIRRELSPLKRSVADSTISDEQLELDQFKRLMSPRRTHKEQDLERSFDDGRMLAVHHQYQFEQQQPQYSAIQAQVSVPREMSLDCVAPQNTFMQVGNMVQIVPAADLSKIQPPQQGEVRVRNFTTVQPQPPPEKLQPATTEVRSKILQVGNMLQIVPTEIVPTDLLLPDRSPVPEIKTEKIDLDFVEEQPPLPASCLPDKASPEAAMLLKVAERRAERERRRLERERRRKEKEKRRKEKEKIRQAKLKIKTENMIKKALELEEEEDSALLSDQPTAQWPPIPLLATHLKEVGKSILVNRALRTEEEERKFKTVHFADGVRPGEGTSPSAGEELTSPPPPNKKLPKEKRYKKLKFNKKGLKKKKVKVKIIRRPPSPLEVSDTEDNLPPPSPPPGSPPPHVFPPRIKPPTVNNVPSAYLATILQAAQQQQQQLQHQPAAPYQSALYRPIGLMMAPPPQGHIQPAILSVPPPNLVAPPQAVLPAGHLQPLHSRVQSPHGAISAPSPSSHVMSHNPGLPPHIQSPHAIIPSNMSVPPPPLPSPHNPGHSRHY